MVMGNFFAEIMSKINLYRSSLGILPKSSIFLFSRVPFMGHIGIIFPALSKNSNEFDAILRLSGPLLAPLLIAGDLDSSGTPITITAAWPTVLTLECNNFICHFQH